LTLVSTARDSIHKARRSYTYL